jgi:hypothetical protein
LQKDISKKKLKKIEKKTEQIDRNFILFLINIKFAMEIISIIPLPSL